ncbi:MAG: aminotransferase class I/II-fold pyridoxal phosphate-dependent enzyme, partial [Gammaproteobacteria bacterium]|nr:aminotransferase class I/II-fold pyridoxal phosphate-dependent enzyme [Gammaproteobacteria bacterium]
MTYRFTPIVEKLPSAVPFVGPEAQERQRGAEFRARIGANESVFGASAKAVHAMQREAVHAWKYGDPENHDLKEALAAHHGVAPRNIVVGEGIDGLFGYTARLFIAPGVPVATSLGAYPTFNYQVATCGGRLVTVPYRDDREDPEALLALTREHDTALVYLSNPDNPMGSWWDAATVQRMIENVPDTALLCLDEAYCDFAPAGTLPEIDVEDTRVLRFRTFSKAHGLAGCRIGYAIGEAQLIQSFDKLRNHFGVNRIAQAGALAALTDRGHLRE